MLCGDLSVAIYRTIIELVSRETDNGDALVEVTVYMLQTLFGIMCNRGHPPSFTSHVPSFRTLIHKGRRLDPELMLTPRKTRVLCALS